MRVKIGEREAGALAGKFIVWLHGIFKAAGLAHDRQSAVAHCDHLRKAARLKARGHEQKIGSGVNAVR